MIIESETKFIPNKYENITEDNPNMYGIDSDPSKLGTFLIYSIHPDIISTIPFTGLDGLIRSPTWITQRNDDSTEWIIGRDGKVSNTGIVKTKTGTEIIKKTSEGIEPIPILWQSDIPLFEFLLGLNIKIDSKYFSILKLPGNSWKEDIASAVNAQWLASGSNKRSGLFRDFHLLGVPNLPF